VPDGEEARILDEISSPSQNMETVILEKHQELQFIILGKLWDDAALVLTYAETYLPNI
jgi:hypothetical protein